MGKKDQFDDLMEGLSGGLGGFTNLAYNKTQKSVATPEQREAIAQSRNAHRGRPAGGERKDPNYKSKTFRISLATDEKLSRIAAVSGKSFKEILDEAVDLLGKSHNL
jgi:hypothetical protein